LPRARASTAAAARVRGRPALSEGDGPPRSRWRGASRAARPPPRPPRAA
jgi:hypothetical protein